MDSTILETSSLESAAAGFGALAHPIRLQILTELSGGQRCVCELLDEIGVAGSLLSHHLAVLRRAGLVEATRRGRWLDYRLTPGGLETLRDAMPAGTP